MTLTDSSTALSPPAPIRVLFADDSAAMRTLARYSLSAKRGFALVGEATNGKQALDLYDTHQPDCVVLDVEMPEMGGFEALGELRRRSPQLPVVMLSGYADEQTTQQAVALGAAAYLEKTHGLVNLADTVRRVIGTPVTDVPAPGAESTVHLDPLAPHLDPPPRAQPAPDTTAADLRRLEYVVSHDLGEPVRVMSGFAGLLRTRYAQQLDDSGQAFLDQVVSGADRLQSMLDDLLVYSRAGRATVRLAPVDTGRVVATVAHELQARIRESDADVQVGPLPAVLADATMLHTVFQQLIGNALTFTTGEAPRVTIGGTVVGGTAVISVTDHGIGIEEKHHTDVFELFRRLNTRAEYPGNGTGLALARRLVEMQNGTIGLESDGRGTVVTVTLPLPPSLPLPLPLPLPLQGETP